MDADRFDALSRALTSPGSRRTTLSALLGALLGMALPESASDALAARKGKRQRRATRKDRQEAAQLESGEVRASDVGAATHCLPPGAKPCKNGSQCCSGRCKKKKKKCLPCATGTEYCASQEACVDSAEFEAVCTGDGGTGTCQSNSECCPADYPDCTSNNFGIYKYCENGSCVCAGVARPQYPAECTFANSNSQCHECCNNDDCVLKTGDPNRVCNSGSGKGICGCGGDKPKLCSERVQGGKTYCTDPRSDPENCSPFVEDCGFKCTPGWDCINGQCTFPG